MPRGINGLETIMDTDQIRTVLLEMATLLGKLSEGTLSLLKVSILALPDNSPASVEQQRIAGEIRQANDSVHAMLQLTGR